MKKFNVKVNLDGFEAAKNEKEENLIINKEAKQHYDKEDLIQF